MAAFADYVVAVGGNYDEGSADAAVWTYRFGEASWSQTAGSSAFPAGATLTGVAGVGQTIVACGYIVSLARTLTVTDDETGEPILVEIFGSRPAIFSSDDAVNWETVVDGVDGVDFGAFSAITARGGGTEVIAIGPRYLEAGISEGYGLFGLASSDGDSWTTDPLEGLDQPSHGSITALTQLGEETLMATRTPAVSRLFSAVGRTWQEVASPAPDISYIAAGPTADGPLLAGIDLLGNASYWTRSTRGWRKTQRPARLPAGARVTDLELTSAGLVATGSHDGRGFVSETGG